MESEDVPGVINGLEGTDYSPVLSDILNDYSVGDSIAPFETALDNYINEIAKRISLKNQFGIGPMIGFLNKKKRDKEFKDDRSGKREPDLSATAIKEMLV